MKLLWIILTSWCVSVQSTCSFQLLSLRPSHHNTLSPAPEAVADAIIEIIKEYQLPCHIDLQQIDTSLPVIQAPVTGYDKLRDQLLQFIKNNKQISFRITGFPCKSPNIEGKTLSVMPDMAERCSLEYLQNFMDRIGKVYKKGANLLVICIGSNFNDLLGVHDAYLVAYETGLKHLASDLQDLTIVGSYDLTWKEEDFLRRFRDKVMVYQPSITMLKKQIKTDPATAHEWERFKKRIGDHFLANKRRKGSVKKEEGGEMDPFLLLMFSRSIGFRIFLDRRFASKNYIHLTYHFSSDVSEKISIKLTPNSFLFPWDGVAVLRKNGKMYIENKDTVEKYCKLTWKIINSFWCPYFVES